MNGCVGNSFTVTVTVNPVPTLYVVSGDITICTNDSVTIGLSGSQINVTYYLIGGTNTLVTNGTGSSIIFSAVIPTNSPTTYTVVATNSTGCGDIMGNTVVTLTNCAPLVISLDPNPPPFVVLTWGGNRWLESAGTLTDPWTNIVQGTNWLVNNWTNLNHFTNLNSTSQQFFRITAPTNGP